MKVVILAGGYGTRLSEETELKPKPMVHIGGMPILWHIMKTYSHYGFDEFIILLGYKGYVIKEYFFNYFLHQSDVTIDLKNNSVEVHNNFSESWKVTLLDTGLDTMTGGRIKRAKEYINNETFMLTYGDGVADINLKQLERFHRSSNSLMTLTSVQPEGRFGNLDIHENGLLKRFNEKPIGDNGWINGGYFMCEPEVLDYIEGDGTIFEKEPLENIVAENKVFAYQHQGFWKCMDTLRDKQQLENMWQKGNAPWKIW